MENKKVTTSKVLSVKEIYAMEFGDSIDVYTKDGQVIRTFTKEVHGDNFAELANEFSKKHGYSLK